MDVEREAREQIVPTDEECDKLNKWLDAQDDPFQILAHMRKVGNVPQLLWMFAKDHDRRVRAQALRDADAGKLTLDTDEQVFFYENDFYPLSNFSAFCLYWKGLQFYNSEVAYHWEKFPDEPDIQAVIRNAISAHESFKIAECHKASRRKDWDVVKVDIMRDILRAKASQHEYVRRKLLQTGDRELIENSWRDDFWGWGKNRGGQNMLGKLWMEIRTELRRRADEIEAEA